MEQSKLETISSLFEGKEIRSVWDSKQEEYYFSVVDVINALAEPKDASDYWTTLKRRMIKEEVSELPTICRKLKIKAKDGKFRQTDTLDTEGIFRLIESIPSSKAEPFKLWLANLGRQKVDEVFDPSKGIDQMIDFYLKKGYDLDWIEARIKVIINRKKLTEVWQENGIKGTKEYAILTNAIYKEWSGMTASEYKKFKGIKKESLRDNMDNLEVSLTDISEEVTKRLVKKTKPKGLNENIKVAKQGGKVAKNTRDEIEKLLGESVVISDNKLGYKYMNENKKIEDK